jgi:large subunit ribosomal protein L10
MAKIKQATKKTGKGRKEVIVAQLVEKLETSNGLVFTDYKGLTHKQLEDLKKELKKLDSTVVIAKNTLLKLAIDKSKFKENGKDIEAAFAAPTATLFITGDMVEPLKKLSKLIKDAGLPHIKVGILEGSVADEAGVLKIASLPSRETLLAQFVGMLNSPIQGFVSGLNAIPQKFVMTLDAIAKAKPADATPAPAAEPTQPTDSTPAETPAAQEGAEVPQETETAPADEAAPANEPAETPAGPLETDENVESAEPATESTDTNETVNEEVNK